MQALDSSENPPFLPGSLALAFVLYLEPAFFSSESSSGTITSVAARFHYPDSWLHRFGELSRRILYKKMHRTMPKKKILSVFFQSATLGGYGTDLVPGLEASCKKLFSKPLSEITLNEILFFLSVLHDPAPASYQLLKLQNTQAIPFQRLHTFLVSYFRTITDCFGEHVLHALHTIRYSMVEGALSRRPGGVTAQLSQDMEGSIETRAAISMHHFAACIQNGTMARFYQSPGSNPQQ